jgi:hypothetical protein
VTATASAAVAVAVAESAPNGYGNTAIDDNGDASAAMVVTNVVSTPAASAGTTASDASNGDDAGVGSRTRARTRAAESGRRSSVASAPGPLAPRLPPAPPPRKKNRTVAGKPTHLPEFVFNEKPPASPRAPPHLKDVFSPESGAASRHGSTEYWRHKAERYKAIIEKWESLVDNPKAMGALPPVKAAPRREKRNRGRLNESYGCMKLLMLPQMVAKKREEREAKAAKKAAKAATAAATKTATDEERAAAKAAWFKCHPTCTCENIVCPQARFKYCMWCDQVKKRACGRPECKAKASASAGSGAGGDATTVTAAVLPGDVGDAADAAPGVLGEPPRPSDASVQRDDGESESEYETGDDDSSDDDGY